VPDAAGTAPHRLSRAALVPVLAALILLAFLAAPPHALTEKAWQIGYGLCHQQADRSFFVGGRQLPLCARDTGTYLGALATLGSMLATHRQSTGRIPTPARSRSCHASMSPTIGFACSAGCCWGRA